MTTTASHTGAQPHTNSPHPVWNETILVANSVKGKKWRWLDADARTSLAIQQRHKLSPLTASLLAGRGVALDHVEAFLQPRLRDFLPDPMHLLDMDKAIPRLVTAIQNNEKIVIFGDYDVDGITSTSLMWRYLHALGINATRYLPDRILEGYGPNSEAVDQLVASGHTLMLCLDCGITAFEPLAHAKEMGLDVIVIDHHQGEAQLPEAIAVVNPNRIDEDSSCKHLAAVGVTFLTLVALNSALKKTDPARTIPNLMQWLDLVALGTVCDVMPLRDINRAFVVQGLKVLAMRQQAGLCALMDQVKLDQMPTTYHAGFVLGPRLNAAGRIASSHLGAELLCTHDPIIAQALALQLDDNNRQRQDMERSQLEHALGLVAGELDNHDPIICIGHTDYHAGIIGLLASRLKEQFQRPAIAMTYDGDYAKASARSMTGIDLGQLVLRARQQGLIIQGGGHAMAAGFKVMRSKISELHDFLKLTIRDHLKGERLVETVTVDGIITCHGATLQLAQEMELLEPFGQGNPTPKLVIKNLRIQGFDVIKDKHLRVYGVDDGGLRLTSMVFNAIGTPLGNALQKAMQQKELLHVMGTLRVNQWQGRSSAQFTIEDAAFASDLTGSI